MFKSLIQVVRMGISAGLFVAGPAFAHDSFQCKPGKACAPKHQTHLGTLTKATAEWENGSSNDSQLPPRVMVTVHGVAAPIPSGMEPPLENFCFAGFIAYPGGLTYDQAHAQRDALIASGKWLSSKSVHVVMGQLPMTFPFEMDDIFSSAQSFPENEGPWTIYVNTSTGANHDGADGNTSWAHCDGVVDAGGYGGKNKVFTTLDAAPIRLQIDEKAINRVPVTLPGPRHEPATVEEATPTIRGAPTTIPRPEDAATPSTMGAPR
jgi:hypothetical protein